VSNPVSLCVADFNSDLFTDFSVIESIPNQDHLVVFANDGQANFSRLTTFMLAETASYSAAADLDSDADVDIAFVINDYTIQVCLNDGVGNFSYGDTVPYAGYPTALAIVDVDRDSDLDIIAPQSSPEYGVKAFLNAGNGDLGEAIITPLAFRPRSVATADIDNDEIIDLVMPNSDRDNVAFLKGFGDGSFDSLIYYFGVGIEPVALAAADFDGDDDLDLAVVNSGSNDVSILLATPPETDAIGPEPRNTPRHVSLLSSYPNPFNTFTTITVTGAGEASIGIFDIRGRKVTTLKTRNGKTVWNARGISSGIYFARVLDGDRSQTIKLIYLK
jgi:hypothetical protein